MTINENLDCIKPKLITEIRTQVGYLQILEYVLQDYSFLHVVQWYLDSELVDNKLVPNVHSASFYRDKERALQLAVKLGDNLLNQF